MKRAWIIGLVLFAGWASQAQESNRITIAAFNLDEYIAGTDPKDALSGFAIYDASSTTNGQFVIYLDAVPGRACSVHWTAALTNDFAPIATNLIYPQDSYTDTVHQVEESGFYRVGVEME